MCQVIKWRVYCVTCDCTLEMTDDQRIAEALAKAHREKTPEHYILVAYYPE